MAATATVTVAAKIAGLGSQIYELVSRIAATAPTDVKSGFGVTTAGWVAVPPTAGAITGVFLEAVSASMKVSLGTTPDETDFTIPEGSAAYVPGPAGTLKVQQGSGAGTYNFIVFGAAT